MALNDLVPYLVCMFHVILYVLCSFFVRIWQSISVQMKMDMTLSK